MGRKKRRINSEKIEDAESDRGGHGGCDVEMVPGRGRGGEKKGVGGVLFCFCETAQTLYRTNRSRRKWGGE